MRILIIICVLVVISTFEAFSQYGSYGPADARSNAMGNTGTANPLNRMPLVKNPALLAIQEDSTFLNLVFPNISANALSTAISSEDINYFFGNPDVSRRYLNEIDKDRLFDIVKGDAEFAMNGSVNLVTIAFMPSKEIGGFAISIDDVISGRGGIPEDFVRLMLWGNEVNRRYDFSSLNFELNWMRSYGLRYAREIYSDSVGVLKYLSGGVAIKMVSGIAHSSIKANTGFITTAEENHAINGQFGVDVQSAYSGDELNTDVPNFFDEKAKFDPMSPAGSGFGFDFGVYGETNFHLKFGVSVSDIGSVSWNTNATQISYFKNITLDNLTDKNALDSLTSDMHKSTKTGEFSTDLPTVLRVGFAYPVSRVAPFIPGSMNLALDYSQGFNESMANSTTPRIGFGMEWDITPYAPMILAGMTNDRLGNWHLSFGLGYSASFLDVFISTQDIMSAVSFNSYASVALTFNWKFL